ncbi:MAB_1171c family putative transporter [Streptomyces sp. ECR3]|uniref:MAB_1171c family putative transporter n=1 Tax=Streptomyces sp. ECR3 TaxID=3400630 RepID=UPI003F19D1E2
MTALLIPVLLWSVAAWRTPAAWRDPRKRPLWAAFAALALAMTLRTDKVARVFDASAHVNNLTTLIKHTCGLIAAHAVLNLVHAVVPESARGRSLRINAVLPASCAAAMTVLFATAPQPREVADPLTEYAGSWQITAYGTVFLAYLTTALVSGCRLCWKWGRQPGSGRTGLGLKIVCAGLLLGIAYAVHRAVALLLRAAGADPLSRRADEALSDFFLYGSLVLLVIGTSLPASRRLHAWVTAHRDLLQLYPLWHDLTEAAPVVRLHAPHSRLAEALDPRRTRDRLYRRTIEIRDAAMVLSDHASADLRAEAERHVASHGLVGAQATVAAEACWLRQAQIARLRGDPPEGTHLPPASGGRDLASEIQALTQLARAYRSKPALTFARHP